jgi:hypothetical protein
MGGADYADWLYHHFGGDLDKTIAAYNAGEHAVERYKGVPPYPETQDYVAKVKRGMDAYDNVPDGGMKSSAPIGFNPLNVKGTFELRHPMTGAELADPILKNIFAHPKLP